MTSETDTISPAPRNERLVARVSADQKRLIQRAAALQGRTLSDFLVASAQEAAQRTIREREVIVLDAVDSAAFVEALLNPTPVNDRLRDSIRRYAELMRRGEGG
jgi:uncharacterized protein (DUF1778 family)